MADTFERTLPPEIRKLLSKASAAFVKRPFPYTTADAEAMIRALKKSSDDVDEDEIYGDQPRKLGGYVRLGAYSSESDAVLVMTGEERGQVWMVGNENFPAVVGRGRALRRATLAEWLAGEESEPEAKPDTKTTELDQLGLTLSAGTGPNKDGVLITDVDSASNAAQKGLKSGDVILEVGNVSVKTPDEVANAVKEISKLGRTAVLMRVKSGDQIRLVPVQLKKS